MLHIGIDARMYGAAQNRGIGRYIEKLLEHVEKIDRRNRYHIFLKKENSVGYRPHAANFTTHIVPLPWYTVREQALFPAVLRRHRLDLVHFPHFNVPVFLGVPYIATIHDLIMTHYREDRATTKNRILYAVKMGMARWIMEKTVMRARHIIVPSQFTKQELQEKIPDANAPVSVIYEGMPERKYVEEKQAGNILGSFRIREPYLLYVGAAYPHKNLDVLLKAFYELLQKNNSTTGARLSLVCIGRQDFFYQRLKKGIPRRFLSRVIFTDAITDELLALLYTRARAFVFPSLVEGFGLPPLEAMAYGVPVTASGIPVHKEILGNAAVYFEADNPRDLARSLQKVLWDEPLRERLGRAGFQRVKKYDWHTMAEQTVALYEKVARG